MEKYLSITEYARLCGVQEQTVRIWMREGKAVPMFTTPGGRPRFLNPEWEKDTAR